MSYKFLLLLLFNFGVGRTKIINVTCPNICKCDYYNGFRRATCTSAKLIDIGNIPSKTQLLDLSFNQIASLRNHIFSDSGLTSLKLLNVSHNKISDIELTAFADMKALKTLNLSYNALQYILSHWFFDLISLEELYLAGNNFGHMGGDLTHLIESKTLKILDLGNSHISYLGPDIFTKIPNLERLDVSHNSLYQIDYEVISPLRHLVVLNIKNNTINCNEVMKKLKDYAVNKSISFVDPCAKKIETHQRMLLPQTTTERAPNFWIVDENDEKGNTKVKVIEIYKCNETEKELLREIVNLSPLLALLITFVSGVAIGVFLSYAFQCKRSTSAKRTNGITLRNANHCDTIRSHTAEGQELIANAHELGISTPMTSRRR